VFAALVRVKGGLVLDVGANTGFYALVAVSVDPSVEVHAFEPYPPVLEVLHANVGMNVRGSRVRVFAEAVGGSRGDALLHIPNPSHGLVETSASLNPAFRVEHDRTSVAVTVTTCCRRATSRPSRPSERRVTMSTCVFVHTRPS
jgi:FkbM family methyltransferase